MLKPWQPKDASEARIVARNKHLYIYKLLLLEQINMISGYTDWSQLNELISPKDEVYSPGNFKH